MNYREVLVAVGSENPAKLSAVQATFAQILNQPIKVVPQKVDSGVPDQPWNQEIYRGAENRCRLMELDNSLLDFYVGVESGVLDSLCGASLMCVEIAVIRHGDLVAVGMSSGFEVPQEIAALMRQEITMSDAADQVLGTERLGRKEGLVGWLTHNRLRRNEYIGQAVQLALCTLLAKLE